MKMNNKSTPDFSSKLIWKRGEGCSRPSIGGLYMDPPSLFKHGIPPLLPHLRMGPPHFSNLYTSISCEKVGGEDVRGGGIPVKRGGEIEGRVEIRGLFKLALYSYNLARIIA
nr:hypothetical protein [Morchella crassipes]